MAEGQNVPFREQTSRFSEEGHLFGLLLNVLRTLKLQSLL